MRFLPRFNSCTSLTLPETGVSTKQASSWRCLLRALTRSDNVRYFLADMLLGGSCDFYHHTAEAAHEMGCQEAVARYYAGVKVINLDLFDRKKVDGKVLITRKGSNERSSGKEIKLNSD